jgi:hypothetical protein
MFDYLRLGQPVEGRCPFAERLEESRLPLDFPVASHRNEGPSNVYVSICSKFFALGTLCTPFTVVHKSSASTSQITAVC